MRKKMFLTLCLSISAILLLSYCLIYVTFRSLLRNEIQEKQQYILDFNETVFTNYIDSFNLIPFQLVDNHEIGSALNTSSSDYLDMFRAREGFYFKPGWTADPISEQEYSALRLLRFRLPVEGCFPEIDPDLCRYKSKGGKMVSARSLS